MVQKPSAGRVSRIASAEDKGALELLEEYAGMYDMTPGAREASAKALTVRSTRGCTT